MVYEESNQKMTPPRSRTKSRVGFWVGGLVWGFGEGRGLRGGAGAEPPAKTLFVHPLVPGFGPWSRLGSWLWSLVFGVGFGGGVWGAML